MTTTTKVVLCTKRNDTWNDTFTYRDKETQAPIDLSGCTAKLQARLPIDSTPALTRSQVSARDYGAPVIDISTATGEITIDGPAGKVYINVPPEDMGVDPADYDSDLELTYADGTVDSTPTFTLRVLEDVTYV